MNLGHWNGFSLYWLLWLVLGFAPVEFWALWSGHPEDTLSDNVWRLEGSGPTFARYFVTAFLIWLTFHMVDRLFR